eukprot:1040997_1
MERNAAKYNEDWVRHVYHTISFIWLFIKPFTENKTSLLVLVALTFRTNAALSLFTGGLSQHTCALETTKPNHNGLKCWGFNKYGQLGQEHTADIGDGPNEMGSNLPNIDTGVSVTDIVQVVTGGVHTCILTTANKMKCFGGNSNGELGIGSTVNKGNAPNTMGDNLPFVDLGTNRSPVQIAAGYDHTCAVLFNVVSTKKELKCWGMNKDGQLGRGDRISRGGNVDEMGDDLLPIDLGSNPDSSVFEPVQVATGWYFTCALSSIGTVKCFGNNEAGQLGYEDTVYRGKQVNQMGEFLLTVDLGSNFVPVHLEAAYKHVCARSNTSGVKCWGWGGYGGLGYGNMNSIGDRADQPEMGDNLALVDLGTNITVFQITAGSFHMCALTTTRNIKCWGSNNAKLGNGDEMGDNGRSHIGDERGEMGDNLAFVDLGIGFNSSISEVQAARYHTCAASLSDEVKCWGENTFGYLGLGHTSNVGGIAGEMGNTLPVVDLVFVSPTSDPTDAPTRSPTNNPTLIPTINPSVNPSQSSVNPTKYPSADPTAFPTKYPSANPTAFPTVTPSTSHPSNNPSTNPTKDPTTPSPTQDPLEDTTQTPKTTGILVDDVESCANYVEWVYGAIVVIVSYTLFFFLNFFPIKLNNYITLSFFCGLFVESVHLLFCCLLLYNIDA